MESVKIISNPYEKKIRYQSRSGNSEQWTNINRENNPNSKLLREDMTDVFFPFNADRILDVIMEEYRDEKGNVAVVFEGTEDEYQELVPVCGNDKYRSHVRLSRSDKYLENAEDILPYIRAVYRKIDPLISRAAEMESSFEKRETGMTYIIFSHYLMVEKMKFQILRRCMLMSIWIHREYTHRTVHIKRLILH